MLFGRAAPSGLDGTSAATPATPAPTGVATPPLARTPTASVTPTALGSDVATLIRQANESFARQQELLRSGDFAGYAAEVDRLKRILSELAKLVESPPTPGNRP